MSNGQIQTAVLLKIYITVLSKFKIIYICCMILLVRIPVKVLEAFSLQSLKFKYLQNLRILFQGRVIKYLKEAIYS